MLIKVNAVQWYRIVDVTLRVALAALLALLMLALLAKPIFSRDAAPKNRACVSCANWCCNTPANATVRPDGNYFCAACYQQWMAQAESGRKEPCKCCGGRVCPRYYSTTAKSRHHCGATATAESRPKGSATAQP